MSDTEIRNKEREHIVRETEVNSDGSPVQEVVKDGRVEAEISNKEELGGLVTERNADGTPVKEVEPL